MSVKKLKTKSLNEQVKVYLYGYIKGMDFSKGTQLPREEALAEQLGVSRMTVRNVLTELAQDGLVSRKLGKGTFVNQEVLEIKIPLIIATEFEQMIKKSGYKADVKLVGFSTEVAGKEIAKKMRIDPEDKIVVLEKIFYADGNQAIFCIDRFPEKLFKEPLALKDSENSIFKLLFEKNNKKIVRDVTEVYTVHPDEDEKLKNIFNNTKSLLVCDAINFDQDDKVVLYDTEYYNTDFIKFNVCRRKEFDY